MNCVSENELPFYCAAKLWLIQCCRLAFLLRIFPVFLFLYLPWNMGDLVSNWIVEEEKVSLVLFGR